MRTKVIYGASPCVELENCIPAFHHQFARLLCIFQQTNRQQPKAAQYKMLLCIKVKSKCVTLAVRSWKLGSVMVFWGAFSGFSGVLGALCLFRLRGSRQNKVKCFIYGLCVCVCVCVGGRGKCHMRCSNKTNSEEDSGSWQDCESRMLDPP